MPFQFQRLAIPDVVLITPEIFGDERGFFMETYKQSDFKAAGLPTNFSQDNHSFSNKGILRGLHYQLDPYAQGKLVRVAGGRIFEVVVDIRKGSPTFAKWISVELSSENKKMLWIPKGFAHGVLVLEDATSLLYKCVGEYMPKYERSLLWNDPALAITWPDLGRLPELSKKDSNGAFLEHAEINYFYDATSNFL